MTLLDAPAAVRPGEELDTAKLGAWLHDRLPELSGTLSVQQFPSGFSNLTYALTLGDRELVLRRPPFGTKPKSGHDMAREYRVLTALRPHFPYCPAALLFCDDPAVMGCEFYVMERLRGLVVRRDYAPGLAGRPDLARAQCEALIDGLARLHQVDFAAAGLGDLGRPAGYVERQVSGWTKRLAAARTPDAPDLDGIAFWLAANLPPESGRATLIHNDYKLDNVIFRADDPTRLLAVLDWEMTTLGDPLMDLGCTLSYWVEAGDPDYMDSFRMMPTNVAGALTRAQVLERYSARTGTPTGDFTFYYVFGVFRLAVVLLQIYYRYYHGQTRDARFGALIGQVHALARTATVALQGRAA